MGSLPASSSIRQFLSPEDPTQQEPALDNCAGRSKRWGWEIRWRQIVQQAGEILARGSSQRSIGLRDTEKSETMAHFTRPRYWDFKPPKLPCGCPAETDAWHTNATKSRYLATRPSLSPEQVSAPAASSQPLVSTWPALSWSAPFTWDASSWPVYTCIVV
jgi:hypothetical protein